MSYGNKRIKPDPDLLEPIEKTNEGDVTFEEMSVEPCDKDIELEAANCSIKYEIEQTPMEATQYMIKIDANLEEMNDDNTQSVTNIKSNKSRIRDFICTTCNFISADPLDFTNHWLSHETRTYIDKNGEYVCQISDCFHVARNINDILVHIASQHLFRYRCAFCYYVTYSSEDFDVHSSKHFTYQCLKCDLQSTKHFFVQNHLETPFECVSCDFKTYHWIPYKKHINMHRYPPDSIIECGFCGFKTGDNRLLKKHLMVHCGEFMLCKMCNFDGRSLEDLDNHYKSSHNRTLEAVGKLHKCKYCTCKFINPDSKELHEKCHFKENTAFKCCTTSKRIQCPYCNHKFVNIHEHIQMEHSADLELEGFRYESTDETVVKLLTPEYAEAEDQPKAEQVEYEEAILISEDDLEEHRHHCSECPRIFKDMNKFEKHLLMVHNMTYEEPIKKKSDSVGKYIKAQKEKCELEEKLEFDCQSCVCPFCYVAYTKDEFEAHCQTHTIFKCNDCDLESTKRLFVDDHVLIPWGCQKCDFKAHHWFLLKKHSFSHDKVAVAVFKCKECTFLTRNLFVLKSHQLAHLWAFLECKICTFKTGNENALKDHYEIYHSCSPAEGVLGYDNRRYECDFCDCKFGQQIHRDKHRALHERGGLRNVRCSQCYSSKTLLKDDNEKDTNGEGNSESDSWTKCPYCPYKDEVRYTMMAHLSQSHLSGLQIEGFRYGEITNNLDTTNRDPRECTLTQKKKVDKRKTDLNVCASNQNNEDTEASTSGAKQIRRCSVCTFSTVRKEYMEKHILTKHHNSMYRCDICGQLLKAMFIKAHMEGNHPPLIASVRPVAESKFERKMLFCSLCKYSSKSKYVIRRHMVSQHLTELEEENSIINEIEEFEFIPHAEDLQKTPANIQFELISEEEDAYLEEGEVEDEVIELEEIEQANEGSDDIALSNAVKEEDPDNIQQPIEEFENIPHAEDLQKDPANIPFELTSEEEDAYLKEGEVEDEVIELEEIEQANEGSDDIALSNAVKEEDPDNIQQPIEEFENIPHAEDLQKNPANIQFELTSEEEDAYLKEGEVEDEVIELEEIEQANEGSDDIALSNAVKEEDPDNIQQPIEEFENIQHAEDLQKDPHNIQPKEFEVASEEEEVANVEAKEEVIELDEISLTCTSNEDIYDIHQPLVKDEIHIEDTDSPEIETVEDIFAVDAACSSNEQRQSKQERALTYDQAQRRWYCQQCSYSGKSRHYAVSHFEHVHRGVPKKKMQCEICSYESGSWRYFNEHINRKHRTEPRPAILPDEGIPCKQQGCDYKAPSVDELSRHVARHLQTSIQEMMKYKCEECNFATVSKAVLKKHKCMPVRLFECYGCRFKCDMRINLYQHIYKCHGYTYSKKKGYRCRKCGCAAKGKTWMKRHYAKCSEK